MKKVIILFFCLVGFVFSGNVVVNYDFENGIDGWYGMKLAPKPQKDNSILSWEKTDTYGKSKGALKVDLNKIKPPAIGYSHNSGAVCQLSTNIPKGTTVVISFYAKSLEGSRFLNINRMWGGANKTVELTDEWEKYTVELTFPFPTSEILFTLVKRILKPSELGKIEKGVFLLDNVKVETKESIQQKAEKKTP